MTTQATVRHAVDLTDATFETYGGQTYITTRDGQEYVTKPGGLEPVLVVAPGDVRIKVRPDLIEPVGNALSYFLVTLAPPQTMVDQPRAEQMQCRLTATTFRDPDDGIVLSCTETGTQNHQQWTELLGDAAHGVMHYGYRTEVDGTITQCYYPAHERKGHRLHLHVTQAMLAMTRTASSGRRPTIMSDWQGMLWQVWEGRSCGLPRCLCDSVALPLLMQHGDEEVQAQVVVVKGAIPVGEAPLPTMAQWREWTKEGSARKGTLPYAPKGVK